ncbi:sugar phosphate isomerase/epimerase [Motilibacter peucedani]|uniref:Sugar phosphate isomerase/epimerase n=1 Tax=Motilibacter peucedani TaxID=598650 RepID=A0A420XNA1_9ACTN|nr:sugar phosphate isomerase/epimerase [Motilibacter peucedani]RKS72751.1 sugar phosphate isomerase/epimerase [Motilibacter peucedani]
MTTPETSVQLYAVRQALDDDLDGTFARLAGIGFGNVEAFDFVRRVDALKAAAARHGLAVPTAHAILLRETAQTPDGLLQVTPPGQTMAAAAELGVQVLIDPYVPLDQWTTADDIARTAETINTRAQEAASLGLRVGYHNHEHELRTQVGGRPALEVFADQLEPDVLLEVDLYWAAAGGADPAQLLQRLGERVVAVHVKDGPMRPGITSRQMPQDQSPAGTGDVPLAEALAAGSSLRYAVVEFDHYEGDIFAGISQSYDFLQQTLETAR